MMIFFRRGRQYYKRIILGCLAVVLLLTGLFAYQALFKSDGRVDSLLVEASKNLSQYDIVVDFNPEDKTLSCFQRTEFINDSNQDFTHLYFHLYPNAFKYENKPVFGKDEMEQAYPNGFSPGYIEIERVKIDNTMVDFIIGGYSEDMLMLLLNGVLAPGEKTVIDFYYTVRLPNSLGRFGYGDNTFKAANWYPIAAVFDDEGWHLNRYYSIGDPFYSNMANYKVFITAPEEYVVATTGDIISHKSSGGFAKWEIEAKAVRDFAWLASDSFKVSSTSVDGTKVFSYYFTEPYGLDALQYAANALKTFNEAFGKYPYRQFSVVEADFFIGGMEYPNLVMIDHRLYSQSNLKWLEIVTVHETAHQWWYGLVGNNQIDDAWLDEGLTEYATILYYGYRYGQEAQEKMYRDLILEGKYMLLQEYVQGLGMDQTIHRPSYEFHDWVVYDLLVYGKAAMMFHEIHQIVGDTVFYDILKEYYRTYRFQNVKKEDLIGLIEDKTGQDWEEFFNQWLYDTKKE